DASLTHRTREVQQAMTDTLYGSGYAIQLTAFPWATKDSFPWNLNPMIKKLHSGVRRLTRISDDVIAERRERREAGDGERHDLLDKLLHLDRDDLRGHLMTFLIAGSETTAMTVAWCLYYFCLHPDIQDKARAEADQLGHDPQTIEDLEKLPFVECCILETLRVQPVAGLLPHECVETTALDGKEIQPGTVVVVMLRKAMTALFEGGTQFKPERWLYHDGSGVDRLRARDHLGFGGGPRQCPGQSMALKEGTILLATILRHFDRIRHSSDVSIVRRKSKITHEPENLELVMQR
ncbi:hypothetical protein FOZ62_004820, partial [Perkinsus olseni]